MRFALAKLVLTALALCVALAHAPTAWAHAALVKSEPADGAVMAAAPPTLRLTFNEPVSPLTFHLIGPDGAQLSTTTMAANAIVTVEPSHALGQGTHLLSWRVVSADGHPVGGSLIFSIGAPSAQPPAAAPANPVVRGMLWAAKVMIYLALFIGIGGAFFRCWIADPQSRAADSAMLAMLVAGLVAVPISVGLHGLDALDLPLSGLQQRIAWQTGLETSYGFTAIAAACALFAAVFSFAAEQARAARILSLVAVLGIGAALALSGHASNAAPQVVNRAAVFAHTVCAAFWAGALLPLLAATRGPHRMDALTRFSRSMPVPLVMLIASGVWLSFVQLQSFEALWTTSYGELLFRKLVAVAVLLSLAAANRYWLAPRLVRGGTATALRLSIAAELVVVLAILAIVALWRFTPPPRALVAATTVSLHIHGEKAMAEIEFTQDRPRGAKVTVIVLDGAFQPLAAKEVTLVLANAAADIEPFRRIATRNGENLWSAQDVRIPLAGRWNLQVEILINDFEKVVLADGIVLPRMP